MPQLAETAIKTNARACYDCGKCTATCPISRAGSSYSPRQHVLATNLGQRDEVAANGAIHACLTCSLCDRRCPADVEYTTLVRLLRELTYGNSVEPECPHGGALQSVMRMMARGETKQDRLGWLDTSLQTQSMTGEVFYWTGCAMYYDAFFSDLGVATLDGTKAAIRLMNAAHIAPVVSPEERCCGHDLLWNGAREHFEMLARHNVKLVADSGADVLVISCAECLRTWKIDYEPFFEVPPPRMLHISEYLLEVMPRLKFKSNGQRRVTYQDPCRLGRHLGIYDPPRRLLAAVPDLELKEMPRSGSGSICCAGGTWSHCDRFSKRIQTERLQEARRTGADMLVTACPKCRVHFRCAMKDPTIEDGADVEIRDLAEVIVDALRNPNPRKD